MLDLKMANKMQKELKLPGSPEVKFRNVHGEYWLDDNHYAYTRDEQGMFRPVASLEPSSKPFWTGVAVGYVGAVAIIATVLFIKYCFGV